MKTKDLRNVIIFIVITSLFIMLMMSSQPTSSSLVKVNISSSPSEKPSLLFKSSFVQSEKTQIPIPSLPSLPSLPFNGKPSPLSFPCEVNISQLKENMKTPLQKYIYQLIMGDMSNSEMVEPLLWCVYSPQYLANFKKYAKPLYGHVNKQKLDNIVTLSREFLDYYTANGLTNPCQLKTLRVHMVEPITEYNHQLSFQLQQLA